jgi:hypothetical protein
MKKLLTIIALVAVIALGFSTAPAQVPMVQIVFDQSLTEQTHVCTPGTQDSAFVVARNFNIWMVGIEFAIDYPASVMWPYDANGPDLTMGNTDIGFSGAWMSPQNAYQTLKICTIVYYCNSCPPDTYIKVIPHPDTGDIKASGYPDVYTYVYGIGWTSTFCPDVIPTDQTTWGNVKAMYQ